MNEYVGSSGRNTEKAATRATAGVLTTKVATAGMIYGLFISKCISARAIDVQLKNIEFVKIDPETVKHL